MGREAATDPLYLQRDRRKNSDGSVPRHLRLRTYHSATFHNVAYHARTHIVHAYHAPTNEKTYETSYDARAEYGKTEHLHSDNGNTEHVDTDVVLQRPVMGEAERAFQGL